MPLTLDIICATYPIKGTFRIARSAIDSVHVVQVSLDEQGVIGRGECRPYPRYNQTVQSVTSDLEQVRSLIESGNMEAALDELQSDSTARNALESAWVDLNVKRNGISAAEFLQVDAPSARQTAFTLSWGSVESMTKAAKRAKDYPWLKIKIGTDGLEQVLAVSRVRPDARLIIDANEALSKDTLPDFLAALKSLNIALIEQPLPAGHEIDLPDTNLVICADEGLHTIKDLPKLWTQGYRAVNVKLDKCGGPIAARDLIVEAKAMGFMIMAGCMVGSSLAMAPMMTLESLCDIIDLDGALLLSEDIENGLKYEKSTVFPPTPELWG